MNYDSDYEVRLATLAALGGDTTKKYKSVYEIDLAILALTEAGAGNDIEEVDELPDASDNRGKILRLSSDDKVYIANLESSVTVTTNKLPDEQQIDKAYLYEDAENIYFYKGAYTLHCDDGDLIWYRWGNVNIGAIATQLSPNDNIDNQTACIGITDYGSNITESEATFEGMTTNDVENDDTLGGYGITPIVATYNAPEEYQIGNAYLYDGEQIIYHGEYTILCNDGNLTAYGWATNRESFPQNLTSKPASEMYFIGDNIEGFTARDFNIYYINDAKVIGTSGNQIEYDDTIANLTQDIGSEIYNAYIPQLNAPDSEQVGVATIEDVDEVTLTYTGNEVTLTASNGIFTCYLWEHVEDNMILLTNTNAANTFGNTIYYWAENGDIVKIDDTHYEAQSDGLDSVGISSLSEDGYEISTVKYQRSETTETWGWGEVINEDYPTDAEIDELFPAIVKRVLMKDSEEYGYSINEGLINENDETIEFEGQTYYKWIKSNNSNGSQYYPTYWGSGDDRRIIILTTSLEPTLPFTKDSPEYAYSLLEGVETEEYDGFSLDTYSKEALEDEDGNITYRT